jgi:beta-lactam-binding protein with PASTA domain
MRDGSFTAARKGAVMQIKRGVLKVGIPLTFGAVVLGAVVLPGFAGANGDPVVPRSGTPCNVPKVVGFELSVAENFITANHCTVGTITEDFHNRVPKGHVIAQRPTTGSGPTVSLAVSLGPAPAPKKLSELQCHVPNIVGLHQAEAEQDLLVKTSCEIGRVKTETNKTQPFGVVFATQPPAGTTHPGFTKVDLYVSSGPPRCDETSVVGYQLTVAEQILLKRNCTIGTITEERSDAPKAQVIAQRRSGEFTVALTVSLGIAPARCKVPHLVGKSQAQAESDLVRADCGVGTVTESFSSVKPKYEVLSQHPKAGTTGPPGTKVNLDISKGNQPTGPKRPPPRKGHK